MKYQNPWWECCCVRHAVAWGWGILFFLCCYNLPVPCQYWPLALNSMAFPLHFHPRPMSMDELPGHGILHSIEESRAELHEGYHVNGRADSICPGVLQYFSGCLMVLQGKHYRGKLVFMTISFCPTVVKRKTWLKNDEWARLKIYLKQLNLVPLCRGTVKVILFIYILKILIGMLILILLSVMDRFEVLTDKNK